MAPVWGLESTALERNEIEPPPQKVAPPAVAEPAGSELPEGPDSGLPEGPFASRPPKRELAASAQESGGLGQANGDSLVELEKKLAGDDDDVGRLAAFRLVEVVASNDAARKNEQRLHLEFLRKKLTVANVLSEAMDLVAAERIVSALGTWISSNGPPFGGVREILLPLIGLGNSDFRAALTRALTALVRVEQAEAAAESATLQSLSDALLAADEPPPSIVQDATQVIWAANPKRALSTIIAALEKHTAANDRAARGRFLEELRFRVPINFPTTEGWRTWWEAHKDLPLEQIYVASLETTQSAAASNWKALLRRLRETGDAEHVLLAIQDTLAESANRSVRLAAVEALGDYAQWVRSSTEEGTGAEKALSRDQLLSRAVQILVSVARRRAFPLENPDVLRGTFAALQQYHVFLDREPPLAASVSALLEEILDESIRPQDPSHREFLLEALRLAGALRVEKAGVVAERILSSGEGGWPGDLDVLTTAVAALGRLSEGSLSLETVSLVIEQFKRERDADAGAVSDFRRACVAALQGGSKSSEVRTVLRTFYGELLSEGAPKEHRVRAILGLGSLAQQEDTEALGKLVELLERPADFTAQELMAVLDSIAFLDDDGVVGRMLAHLPRQERVVQDYILKKIVGLVEKGGLGRLHEAVQRLQGMALASDVNGIPLEYVDRICSDPAVAALLAPEKSDLANKPSLIQFWDCTLSWARSRGVGGDVPGAQELVARLEVVVGSNPAIQQMYPAGVAASSAFAQSLGGRGALASAIQTAEPAAVVKSIATWLQIETVDVARLGNLRWVVQQLGALSEGDRRTRLIELLSSWLVSSEAEAFWADLPDEVRERLVSRLKALDESAG